MKVWLIGDEDREEMRPIVDWLAARTTPGDLRRSRTLPITTASFAEPQSSPGHPGDLTIAAGTRRCRFLDFVFVIDFHHSRTRAIKVFFHKKMDGVNQPGKTFTETAKGIGELLFCERNLFVFRQFRTKVIASAEFQNIRLVPNA